MELPIQKEGRYTYADYLTWDDGQRWELINGKAYNMTPAPNRKHQALSLKIVLQMGPQLEGKSSEVYFAPFDVMLPFGSLGDDKIENVVQPDISVICDPSRLDEKGCLGAPDLVVEILSPYTSRKDKVDKFFLYEQVGVKEYWLVSPEDSFVEVFRIGEDGKYGRPDIYCEKDTIRCLAVKGLTVDLGRVFA